MAWQEVARSGKGVSGRVTGKGFFLFGEQFCAKKRPKGRDI